MYSLVSLKLNFCFGKNIVIHQKPSYTKLDWEDQTEQSALISKKNYYSVN